MDKMDHSRSFAARLIASAMFLAIASTALAGVHYVDVNSTNATPPYTNWVTAATNIQDAVDAAVAGDEIVVTNGTYATGGRSVDGLTGNRVAVDKPLNVRSINGPQFTVICGCFSGRCVYLTNGASLSGFTLTAGSAYYGGGAYGGTLTNCTLTDNETLYPDGSGDIGGYGGGAAYCTLNNCTLSENTAGHGGGAYGCTLNNCALYNNEAVGDPGYDFVAKGGG